MADQNTPPGGELREAIHAVVRSGLDGDDNVRKSIVERAKTAGASALIPDNWNSDGSLKETNRAWSTVEERETYNDTYTALSGAVSDAVDDYYTWIQDFTDTEVIFYAGECLWSVAYTLESGGAVTLNGDPVKVRPVTTYVAREADAEIEARRQRAEMLDGVQEVRHFQAGSVEVREASDGMLRFTGYASVTERGYEVGDFEETIARGAFKRTLSESPDVVFTINHGTSGQLPLARTKSGTLALTEDARGLRVDADLNPDDPDVKALVPKLQRGDVDEMSFAFRVTDQSWSEDRSKRLIRGLTLHKGDVSVVTYGANDASTGGLARMLDAELVEMRAGKTLSAKTRGELEAMNEKLTELLAESDQTPEPAGDTEGERAAAGEQEERTVAPAPVPDLTTRRRERLAVLRGGSR